MKKSKEKRIRMIRDLCKLQMTLQRIFSLTAAGPGNWDGVRTAVSVMVMRYCLPWLYPNRKLCPNLKANATAL